MLKTESQGLCLGTQMADGTRLGILLATPREWTTSPQQYYGSVMIAQSQAAGPRGAIKLQVGAEDLFHALRL